MIVSRILEIQSIEPINFWWSWWSWLFWWEFSAKEEGFCSRSCLCRNWGGRLGRIQEQ